MLLSRQTKLQLIASVKDENFFRKEVLIPLFRNTGKFLQVLDNHGANEKGTDIILVEKGTFSGYRFTSVILKTQSITNSTTKRKDRETAANVSQQIALAIASGHYSNLTNAKEDFNTVTVVTNQTISNTARESLIGDAKMFRFNDVNFLQGEDLLTLIDEYMPNFYYYQSGTHARIAAALQTKCEKLSDFQNLPQFNVQQRALIEVFVKPQLRHIESRWVEGKQKNEILIRTPDQIIPKGQRVLIIGEAGSGKSIIMRQAVLSLLADNTRSSKPILPLLVKAHDLAKATSDSFTKSLEIVIRRYYDLLDFEFDDAQKNANITLLIDGLDEIVDLQEREHLKSQIVGFSNKNPNTPIIVTSRRTQDITDAKSMPSFERWDVLPFNYTQVREFLTKWFSNNEKSSNRLLAALEDHELLSRLPNTPLVLTLLAILYDHDTHREIPANLSELYHMFLDLLLGKWNLDRRVETMHNANIREHLAMEVALQMHRDNILAISKEEFMEIIHNAEKQRGMAIDAVALLNDFTEQTALLVYNDKDQLEFRHLSFQEFLVALYMTKYATNDEITFLVQNFEHSWWTKVLYFYCGLRLDTPEILRKVVERMPSLEKPRQVVGTFELGYLVQAAYLTPIAIRMKTVQAALREFYGCINSFHEVKVDGQKMPEGMIQFALVFWLSMQYSSRMLQRFYRELFDQLKQTDNPDPETRFVLLALAIFMAHNDDFRALSEVHDVVKHDPRQLMILNIVGEVLLNALPPEEKRTADVKEFKATLAQVRKWFKAHPDISRGLLDTPKTRSTTNSE